MGGCLMTAMAALGLSWRLFKLIPSSVKEAMPVGLGLMLALCGFEQMRLVIPSRDTGVTMGDLQEPNVRRRERGNTRNSSVGPTRLCCVLRAVCCALCAARAVCRVLFAVYTPTNAHVVFSFFVSFFLRYFWAALVW